MRDRSDVVRSGVRAYRKRPRRFCAVGGTGGSAPTPADRLDTAGCDALIAIDQRAPRDPGAVPPPPHPFTHLGDHLVAVSTRPGPLIAYSAAVGATMVMIASGADQGARELAQRHVRVGGFGNTWGDLALDGGYVLPVVVPGLLYGVGLVTKAPDAVAGGAAALQALGITVGSVTLLKWITGRPFPNHGGDPNDPARLDHAEFAREFDPFNFHGAYAWPSGHTAASISVAAALTAYYPDEIAVPLVAYPLATAIGLGMIVGDHHWASDVVAGALIGQSVGYTVGAAFRSEVDAARAAGKTTAEWRPSTRMLVVPFMGGAARGMAVVGTF